jgi:hypothetical protein
MTVAKGGGIFISYRRQETSHLAGRLYDRLAGRFGKGQVFIDVDAIEPGVDFAKEIFGAVAACKVLLAIIGPSWLTMADEHDHRRLDNPDDIVRLEVEAALARDVLVIPILAEGAVMPTRQDLPESLADLASRNALHIRHESFHSDARPLVTAIERVLATPGTVAKPSHAHVTDPQWEEPWEERGASLGDNGVTVEGDEGEGGFGEPDPVDLEEDGRFGGPADPAVLAEVDEYFSGPAEASSAPPKAGDADLSP